MALLIKNGTLVTAADSYLADVLVEGERIGQIGRELSAESHQVLDATGMLIMPGGVDVHTHLELPVSGTVSSDDFFSGTRAAAFGGTTTIVDFAIQPKGGSLADGLALWQAKAAGRACVDYAFHANVTDPGPALFAELPRLPDLGVSSVKLLMAYKGTFQVNDTTLFKVMRLAAEHGLLVMVHAENGDVVAELTESLLAAGKREPHHHLEAHPEAAEAEATCRAVSMAGISGARLYVVHMTGAGAVQQLAIGRAKGYPVMGETCVQYLGASESKLRPTADDPFAGAKFVCSPPLRTAADAAALWAALDDGTLQAVSTDHCPFYYHGGGERPAGKELGRGNFARIPNGLPGIEDRLVVTWQLGVNAGRLTPNQFVAFTSTNPARIFGLYPRKGTLAPGSDADIVIWDPERQRRIQAAEHHMRCDYNVYEGLHVRGWPEKVFLRGRLLVDGKDWVGRAGAGCFLPRPAAGEWL
ncbi:MAG: dihydropyrimidinase [Candidatus Promineifilaceae bacterium]